MRAPREAGADGVPGRSTGAGRPGHRDGRSARLGQRLRGVLLAGAVLGGLATPVAHAGTSDAGMPHGATPAVAAAAPPVLGLDRYVAESFAARIDLIVRDGYEHPAAAHDRLEQLLPDAGAVPALRRMLLSAHAAIGASTGNGSEAAQWAEALVARAREGDDPLLSAATLLAQALASDADGEAETSSALARAALATFRGLCAGTSGGGAAMAPAGAGADPSDRPQAPTAGGPACDYRSIWRALHLLARRGASLHQHGQAAADYDAAAQVARRAGDRWREAASLAAASHPLQLDGAAAAADRALGQARRLADQVGDPLLTVRVLREAAHLADARRQPAAAAVLTEEALALARAAHAERLQASLLANLSDLYTQLGQPQRALKAAEAALAKKGDAVSPQVERVMINNAGLAKIGLGRIEEGKRDLARLLAPGQASGSASEMAQSLREFGVALAAAGDARGALELYHRERALTAEVVRRNRNAAMGEMQGRFDAEAKQRSIELLNRDNALMSEALSNRMLVVKNWAAVAAVLALALAGAAWLYHRVRTTQRALERTEARLREQSERDALTNLANRRHLHAVMDAGGPADAAFDGALLLVDIDHFKRINDRHGHGVGDAVLVEFGRRLSATVRAEDLVVRWGGEEFLIVCERLAADQAHLLAARLLERIGGVPFEVQGLRLGVTASIGYGRFPLGAGRRHLAWQQGVNLVDRAMYTAKHAGRNRAIGIIGRSEPAPPGLRQPVDSETGWSDTSPVDLLQTCGARID